ncbi:acyltransferase family protein, partial [Bacteroides heparinolyticus]|uniref:acyltransferase family protein n=1 Tax=Prevotella heparinolytica TaxID=28113 RepID=UPI0035A1A34E
MPHESLFFFYSGYFFREVNLKTPWKFLKGKITTLYIPTIKYGIMFLVLRNLMIPLHLSNQAPIGSWSEFWNNGLDPIIRFYDTEQMMGAFWFLRVLFFANIIFWLLFRIIHAVGRGRYKLLILDGLVFISSSAGFYMNIHEIWP